MKAYSSVDSKDISTYCNQNGHTSFICSTKKNAYFDGKVKLVPKDSSTNIQGPKVMYVMLQFTCILNCYLH